jgi:hypothetical protein
VSVARKLKEDSLYNYTVTMNDHKNTPPPETNVIKTYGWHNNGNDHGLKIIINKEKRYKFHFQTITKDLAYQEMETEKWCPYTTIFDTGIQAIQNACTLQILHEISRDMMINCSPDTTFYLTIKRFGDIIIWLKCRYMDDIEISIFHPTMTSFMVHVMGYEDSYNKYENQFYMLRSKIKKTIVPPSVVTKTDYSNEMYQWVLSESLNYFRPIILKELECIFQEKMCRSLILLILDYICS